MKTGTQFSGTVPASGTKTWFTHEWPTAWNVVWTVIPTSVVAGSAKQVEWDVSVQKASASHLTYFLTVRNLTKAEIGIEARYAAFEPDP